MLTHIHLQNFVLIDSLDIEFGHGLNVLTGETGAGKSIWIDAVGLALGDRADNRVIKSGQDRCDITLSFDLSDNAPARAWLAEHELDNEGECFIRRTINRNGNSRCTLNGTPCPLNLIREFSQHVLLIHGQHESQALLKPEQQRQQLDHFAHNQKQLDEIGEIYQRWQQVQTQIDALQAKALQRDDELKLLRFQHQELSELQLQDGEWQQLSQEHTQLHNAKSLIEALNQTLDLTVESEEVSASQLIGQALHYLESICGDDEQLKSARELLHTAAIHVQEAGDELNHFRNHLDLSPEHLAEVEQRLGLIHTLARKHHVEPEQLTDVLKSLEQKLDELENVETHLETLQNTANQLIGKYNKVASELSKKRQQAAATLNKKITTHIQQLGIKGGEFHIELIPVTSPMTAFGAETVRFDVRTNPGQALSPMNKIVSGGELSRISLALQVITAEKAQTPTLIFDEVDTGIGGKTAEIVGKLLHTLGKKAQVLCITHLAQVAAQAHAHFQVSKQASKNTTKTLVKQLSTEERVNELARMVSGSQITESTLAMAKEMLAVEA